jgi:spore germination protein (amino acid permease)
MIVNNKIQFGNWEAIALLINIMCTQILLNNPRILAEQAGTAAWLLALYIAIVALVAFFIISLLYKPFEGKDILDVSQYALGNIGRAIVGLILIVYLLTATSNFLRQFSENIKTIDLVTSPLSFVEMFFVVGMVVGAYFGIEAIVRFHAIAVPIIAVGITIIYIALFPAIDYTNILPILGTGAYNIFGSGFFKLSIYSGLSLLFFIVPYIKSHENFKKIGYTAIGISAYFFVFSAFIFLAVRSYPTAIENFLPIYQISRMIHYGRFFERIESFFLIMWVTAALLYMTAAFYFAIFIFKKIFNLQYYRPLIVSFAIITFSTSFMPANLMEAIKFESEFFRNFAWIVTFVITILVLVIANIIRAMKDKEAAT